MGNRRYVSFNINYWVRVKLNDWGREMHRRNHQELIPHIEYTPPREDENGWSEWQMHDLIDTFGVSVGMGRQLPFETTIEIDLSGQ